jgi:hypothetical protein
MDAQPSFAMTYRAFIEQTDKDTLFHFGMEKAPLKGGFLKSISEYITPPSSSKSSFDRYGRTALMQP